MTYQYNSRNPKDKTELDYILTHMCRVSYPEFLKNIMGMTQQEFFELTYKEGLPIKQNACSVYFKCPLPEKQKTAYIIRQSDTEFIFY